MVFQLGYSAGVFSKMNAVSLLLQGIKTAAFVANNKVWTFRQKLELHKTYQSP